MIIIGTILDFGFDIPQKCDGLWIMCCSQPHSFTSFNAEWMGFFKFMHISVDERRNVKHVLWFIVMNAVPHRFPASLNELNFIDVAVKTLRRIGVNKKRLDRSWRRYGPIIME